MPNRAMYAWLFNNTLNFFLRPIFSFVFFTSSSKDLKWDFSKIYTNKLKYTEYHMSGRQISYLISLNVIVDRDVKNYKMYNIEFSLHFGLKSSTSPFSWHFTYITQAVVNIECEYFNSWKDTLKLFFQYQRFYNF